MGVGVKMDLTKHMFKQHKLTTFAILAILALVIIYNTFQSRAAADYYWVGGCSDDTWICDDSGETNWSSTSGGARISTFPSSVDSIFFDSNSGSGNSIISSNHSIASLNTLDYTGTITHNASVNLTITGSGVVYILGDSMIYTISSPTTSDTTFTGTSGTTNLTLNGHTLGDVTFNGAGGTWQLQDTFTVDPAATLTLTRGTFDANGQEINIGKFSSSNSNTRSLLMTSSVWSITGTGSIWNAATSTGLTVDSDISTINLTDSSSTTRTVNFGGSAGASTSNTVFYDLQVSAGTGTLIFNSDPSFIVNFNNVDFTGFSGNVLNTLGTRGDITLDSGMNGSSLSVDFTADSGAKTITTNGVSIGGLTFIGDYSTGATWTLQDELTVESGIFLIAGEIDTNDQNVTVASFENNFGTLTPFTLNLGSSTLTITGDGPRLSFDQGLTLNAGTSHVILENTGSNPAYFISLGHSYNEVTLSGDNLLLYEDTGVYIDPETSANALTHGSLGIFHLNNAGATTGAAFPPDASQALGEFISVDDFTTNGSSGNLSKMYSDIPGSPFTLSKSSGIVSVDYMSIKDSAATGGATWFAGANSDDVSGNSGWIFGRPTVSSVVTGDADNDGQIDQIDVTYSRDVDDADYNALAITGYAVNAGLSLGTGTDFHSYMLIESGSSDTGATPALTWTEANATGVISGLNINAFGAPANATDSALPTLTAVSIDSTDSNGFAQVGDTVTISFTASETIQTPITTISSGGNPVAGLINTTNPSGNNWEASYTVSGGDTEGLVTFTIDYEDLVGNDGFQITAVTDSSSVTIGESPAVPAPPSSSGLAFRAPTYLIEQVTGSTSTTPVVTQPATTTFTTTYVETYIATYAPTASPEVMNAIRAIFGLPPQEFQFTQDLEIGDVDEDVRMLQRFLNDQGFTVSAAGPGSSGFETNIFGEKTEAAIIKFQQTHNITPAAGYFGPKTRAVVNNLI